MLIHSSNMDTSVFIHECQNNTKAPKGVQESRQFTCGLSCLLLILVTLLVLLVGAFVMFGFFTVGIAQKNVSNSRTTCAEITNQSNQSKLIVHFNTTDKEDRKKIFEVQETGTYVIYVKVQKNKSTNNGCTDEVQLVWDEQNKSDGSKSKQEAKFECKSGSCMAKILPFVAQLHEESNIYLKINCGAKINGDFYIEKIDDFI